LQYFPAAVVTPCAVISTMRFRPVVSAIASVLFSFAARVPASL